MKKGKREFKTHDQVMLEILKEKPSFAVEYLKTALEEATDKEGRDVLLIAIKRIAEAQGMAKVAKAAGIPRESLYRALSPKGNPRLNTLLAVINATGFKFSVQPI